MSESNSGEELESARKLLEDIFSLKTLKSSLRLKSRLEIPGRID